MHGVSAVGTIGLGGLALAPDQRSLYVINLNTRLCDLFPSGFVYISSTPPAFLSAGRWCWNLGTLEPGASKTRRIKTRTLLGIHGVRVNVATITGRGVRPHSAHRRIRILGDYVHGGGVTG